MDFPALLLAFGKSLLFALAAVLPILNPPASAPVFVTLTRGVDGSTRTLLARRIGQYVFFMLAGAMLVGTYVLDFFGISLSIVQVGGGLVVFSNAWRLLTAPDVTTDRRTELAEAFSSEQAMRQAFYPLTFPISCGPGSIAAAITVGVALHDAKLTLSISRVAGGLLALSLIAVMLYFAFRYAQRLLKPLGEAGTTVFLRMSSFILLCLGVQIIWDGASELLYGVLADALAQ